MCRGVVACTTEHSRRKVDSSLSFNEIFSECVCIVLAITDSDGIIYQSVYVSSLYVCTLGTRFVRQTPLYPIGP